MWSSFFRGGEDRIRTCGTLITHNRLAGGPNQPLWHLPVFDVVNSGARGIRTPGDEKRHNGFQDRRLKPLGHRSNLRQTFYHVPQGAAT